MLDWFRRKPRFSLDVATFSHCGPVRKENQDSFFLSADKSVFVVADGMGGGSGGAQASRLVTDAFLKAAETARGFPDLMKCASDAIGEANAAIRAYAHEHHYRQMGSTLAALFLNSGGGPDAVVCHVGDSRIYRYRDGALDMLTHDHTLAGELSRRTSCKNLLDEVAGKAGYLSHVLTRAVGIEETVIPDWRKIDLKEGDQFLLCSDGVYDMASPEALKAAFDEGTDAQGVADRIARAVVEGGAGDNYTAIILRVKGVRR